MRTKSISQQALAQTQKKLFLQHYAQLGTIGKAAEAAGIARRTAQYWLEDDADFKAGLEEAKAAFTEKLEHEMYRRAHDGWDEPVYYKGEFQGNIRKYSDTLMIFSLKGLAPDKYRERYEHSGANGAPLPAPVIAIQIVAPPGAQLPTAQVKELGPALQMPQDAPQSPTEPLQEAEATLPCLPAPIPQVTTTDPSSPLSSSPSESNLYGFDKGGQGNEHDTAQLPPHSLSATSKPQGAHPDTRQSHLPDMRVSSRAGMQSPLRPSHSNGRGSHHTLRGVSRQLPEQPTGALPPMQHAGEIQDSGAAGFPSSQELARSRWVRYHPNRPYPGS